MFRKEILIERDSYVELASRQVEQTEMLALTLRGPKPGGAVGLATVLLTPDEAQALATQLQAWLGSKAG